MTNLKTLKDLEITGKGNPEMPLIYSFQLKQEAIKWVKELKIRNNLANETIRKINEDFSVGFTMHQDNKKLVDWIKHFFNLTEDELSQEKKGSEKLK